MRFTKKRDNKEEVSYWQSITDIMSALVLILLLIIMLLLLYIIKIPDADQIDPYEGDLWETEWDDYDDDDYDDDDDGGGYDYEPEHEIIIIDGGGGGGGGDTYETEPETEPETETEPIDDLPDNGKDKTAVYVMVVDEETQSTIKEAGITFELYNSSNVLQLLHTYYPEKIEYRNYETTPMGTFYLPEKIGFGEYYLRELNEPKGYDRADNTEFEVVVSLDWPEALIVKVPLSPSKNIIRVQMTDADTGEAVKRGSYQVVAAKDIVTLDGTLRYHEGEIVDEITCNQNGYGESIELFLGDYQLIQRRIPEYYAGDSTPIDVVVEKKINDVLPEIHEITCEKTTVTYSVVDELYNNIPMANVNFTLTWDGKIGAPLNLMTDEFGQIILTNLRKNTTYHLHQLDSEKDYTFSNQEYTFNVSADGKVEDKVKTGYEIHNRITRASVGVHDIILQSPASDFNVALYDGKNKLIHTWVSTAMAETINGLQPGKYYLIVNGLEKEKQEIEITDTAEPQSFVIKRWTNTSLAAVVAAGFVFLAVIIVLIIVMRRKRKSKSEDKTE